MKATGFVKKIDELGRIVIPKDVRKTMGLEIRDSLQFFIDGDGIVMKKFGESCSFCGSGDNVMEFKERFVCKACLDELKASTL